MKIKIDTSPEVVGAILQAKYKRTFFDFALAIYQADCARRFKAEISMEEIIEAKRALEQLPKKIMRPLLECEHLLRISDRKYQIKREYQEVFEYMKYRYHLSEFLEVIEDRLDELDTAKFWFGMRERGRPTSPGTIIIMEWAHLMLEEGKKIDWGLMISLYDWFLNLLGNCAYYGWMSPLDKKGGKVVFTEDHFRIQYSRNKNKYRPSTRVKNRGWRILLFGKSFLAERNETPHSMDRSLELIETVYGEAGLTKKVLDTYSQEGAFDLGVLGRPIHDPLPLFVAFPDLSYWIE